MSHDGRANREGVERRDRGREGERLKSDVARAEQQHEIGEGELRRQDHARLEPLAMGLEGQGSA